MGARIVARLREVAGWLWEELSLSERGVGRGGWIMVRGAGCGDADADDLFLLTLGYVGCCWLRKEPCLV